MAEAFSGGSLRIAGVSKYFGTFRAVNAVDLEIRKGEFLTLLGPSGSGKTTLLMMIAGFLDITSGDIALDGSSIANVPAEKRNFGMVFQGYALFPHMTVRDNIGYALSVRKRPEAEIRTRVDEMLELVQLQDFANRKPGQLSGGQQQRVALARALCFAPPVLLLDEPLGALDKKLRVEVQEQLKDIHRRVGTTFIYVTHDQEEALSMSDRIVIMRDGAIEQVGSPQELYERPATRFAASFLGKSNFVQQNGQTYALRPEKIDIHLGTGHPQARRKGTITSITYFGSMQRIIVETTEAEQIEVDIDVWRNQQPLHEGETVELSWQDAAAVDLKES
ncbi:ABC transporter ATP-binding protein [Ruegeria pomeroyi]|uniref:Opine/polyamine ABC transporter, ATP-binding protein n=2 Tax=Ruegeria pomeroyi TaxID=89184 RepID=Q5LPZ4_RUEPO|nr:ABC transporter ATP-binding protein [Ruegeria pomeroyi]HCE70328.1 ABC transporter ATP-binding protein [Ruegeria sp.]AAV95947.1 opine/polyamine transporter ATP binding protein [Ruegeria pomeroyi DSS-3]NVK98186.1 ABC transporter ATP-binding protein [Ruegeria pomeroyi]NVL02035.1 ABC transporter ATP-binding protein [Ruegeria pomeroyi]QWV09511.1 ABC transporter ATP-binding protein [Ruegeria pomeroyi]